MRKLTLSTLIVVVILIATSFFLIYENKMKNNNIIIPREVLFGNPDKASVSISPDGKKIAYLSARNGVLNIYVANRSEPDKAMPITHDKDRGIRNYFWAYDNEHILYLQDNEGDENWHVYRVNINSLDVKDLTPFEKSRSTIVKSSEKIPDKIIIGTNKRDPRYFDLYEADIISGELKLFYENKDQAISTEVSDDNKKYTVRFITKNNEDGSKTIYKVNGSKLEIFLEVPMEDVNSTFIVGFGETSNIVYISDSLKRNTAALIKYDQKSKRSSVIHHDLKTDIGKVLFHPRTKKVQVVYNTFLKRKEHVLDEEIREDIEYLNEFNQNAELSIISRNLEDKFWIIGYLSDTKPLTYYLYDRHHKKMKFLFSNREDLEKYNLSVMHSLIIKSRDGLDLVSYLTLPQNSRDDSKSFIPMKPVPLVLVVHGGPKGIRDNWGLNNIHQWLANRGYAVLSVNYRASGGFGKKFMNAGDGQWAKKMHDDLLDAVNWAIDNKITTKDKVCIFGGSYGGYAALVGVTFTPDVFACAVDIVGPSNLITLARSIPQYWKPFYRQFLTMLGGDPDTEEGRKFLESRSPLTYVKNIKKPILIGQGANDPRVKQAESDQIVKAMKENKIPVTYLLYPDEGHGFARPENRMSFFAITEKFLNQHLGGEAEPIGDAFKGSSIEILEGKDLKR